jgi:hypothetical protein
MRGNNPNFYVIEQINDIEKGNPFSKISYEEFANIRKTDVKNMNFNGVDPKIEEREKERKEYLDNYNKNHSCTDQKSFDVGYNLAREQYGVTVDVDLPSYLYKISINLGYNYNSYCFEKGVEQYIKEKNN